MDEPNNQIKPLLWSELTDANWDMIYKDCGISLLEGNAIFPALTGIYEIGMVIILISLNGSLALNSSGKKLHLNEGDALICMPGTMLQHSYASPDFKYKVLCLSPDVVAKHPAKKGYFIRLSSIKKPYAVVHFDRQMLELIDNYCAILKLKTNDTGISDNDIIVSNIVGCLLFDILNRIPESSSAEAIRQTHGYKYVIFQNFIQSVSKDNGSLRLVKEYARRLNVSPKYLSVICREISGKSASEWVNEILNSEIERLLRFTDYSLKEISAKVGFSNCSVFSKYIRQNFNMSGVEYREFLRMTSN